jgi:hypothetical protein
MWDGPRALTLSPLSIVMAELFLWMVGLSPEQKPVIGHNSTLMGWRLCAVGDADRAQHIFICRQLIIWLASLGPTRLSSQ